MKQFSDMIVKKIPSRGTLTPKKSKSKDNEQEQQQDDEEKHVVDQKEFNDSDDSASDVGKESGIITAVRVRPLNLQEIGSNSRIIVSNPGFMSHDIQIINPIFFKSSNQSDKLRKLEERKFSFDHTFWSLGDFGDGLDSFEYSNQEDIYEKIGKPIIRNALSGFNSSLFAYGMCF